MMDGDLLSEHFNNLQNKCVLLLKLLININLIQKSIMKFRFFLFFICCLFSCSIEKEKTNLTQETKVETPRPIDAVIGDTTTLVSTPIVAKPINKPKPESKENPDVISMMPHIIIAKSGLFLRDRPSREGEALTKMPYYADIEILSTKSFGKEQVLIEASRTSSNFNIEYQANWVKVKYNKLEGYVHSAYIVRKYNRKKRILKHDFDFALTGSSCDFNFHHNPDLKWYGIYKRKDGFERVPITLEYQIWYGNVMTPILTLVEPSDGLIFCFASGNNLTNGPIMGTKDYSNLEFDMENYDLRLKELGINYTAIEGKDGNNYTLQKDGLHQLLNEEQIESEYNFITSIEWVGDIDEDGKLDYVITYGVKGGRTVLYLSSEAKGNEIAAPVAIYLRSYCC